VEECGIAALLRDGKAGEPSAAFNIIPAIDIWYAAQLMLKRYGDKALVESATHADETTKLAARGDHDGAAIWRRITAAIEQLASNTPRPVRVLSCQIRQPRPELLYVIIGGTAC
jgi:hypothetical protein